MSLSSPGGNHVSMITYDNGGEWQRILAPSGCSDVSVCSLHLYLKSSSLISRRYNLSSASGPLSIKTAPGIIVAHGRGTVLEYCVCVYSQFYR